MPLSQLNNLAYVILLCDDLKRMTAFYRDSLGLKLNGEEEDWVEFTVGSTLLSLRPRGRYYDGRRVSDGASIQISFEATVDQVDDAYRQLSRLGVDILEPPQDQDFGHRTLYFRDPESNIIEVFAHI